MIETTYTLPAGTQTRIAREGSKARDFVTRRDLALTLSQLERVVATGSGWIEQGGWWLAVDPRDLMLRGDDGRWTPAWLGVLSVEAECAQRNEAESPEPSNVVPASALASRRASVEAARQPDADTCDDGDAPSALECAELLDVAPSWPVAGTSTVMVRSSTDPRAAYSVILAGGRATACQCEGYRYRGACAHLARAERCGALWAAFDALLDRGIAPSEIARSWRLYAGRGDSPDSITARLIGAAATPRRAVR